MWVGLEMFKRGLEMFLGEFVLELFNFMLVVLDFVFFLDEELLQGLCFFPKLFLLVVGAVLVLDGFPKFGLEDDELVVGLVFLLLDVPVKLVEFSKLFS